MISGLYNAASGLNASLLNQDVIAANLASADIPGFRRSLVSFASFGGAPGQAGGSSLGAAVSAGDDGTLVQTDFTLGALQRTGNPLDVAIVGDGFFVLQGAEGPLYTRNGVFHLNEQGQIASGNGLTVQGSGGPITVPKEVALSQVRIMADGTVSADGVQFGKLDIVDFKDKNVLTPAGTTSFSSSNPRAATSVNTAVEQGSREMSNVIAVEELTRMIVGMRHYEASQKALSSLSTAIQQNIGTQSG
jgi:flagellar basal body rod protein FlgG